MLGTEQLHDRAQQRGVRVAWADLGRRRGLYEDDLDRITLNLCLTDYQEKSTLAHELSHAHWHDRPTASRTEHQRRERRANAEAARMLITAAEYARAEEAVGPDPGALAVELSVSRWVVEAWQREADAGRAWTSLPRQRTGCNDQDIEIVSYVSDSGEQHEHRR